jgi:predicted metal-dependent peptidase
MTDSRQKRLDKAQLRTLFQVPFFAPGVAKLPVEFLPEVEWEARFASPGQKATACTDGETLYWCAEWFDTLPDQVLVTLLCHEVAHCLLGHLWRLPPPGGDAQVANQAADHAVNLMLKEFSATVTAKRLADPFPFPDDAPGLADPQYAGMSEEAIYAKLMAQARPSSPNGKPQSGQGGGKGGKSGSNHPSGGKNSPTGNVGSGNARQNLPSFGQFKPKPSAQAAQKKLKSDWEGTLIQSVAAMKGRGDLPASMERLVNALVSPSVDWWSVLRSWLREQCADDWNFLAPAMEYSGSGFILPSLKSEKMGPVIFATDTSGSIDAEMLARFQTEKQACLDEMRPKTLLDVYCDAKIQAVRDYVVGDDIKRDCLGGGGTSFVPVWKEIEKRGISPKCLVYLTDLDGDFGEDPGFPVLWITWTKDGKAPFGQVIYAGK